MLTNRAGPCAASRLLLQNRKHACAPARCTAQVCTLLPNRAGPCAASRLLLQNREHACAPARCTAQVCTMLPVYFSFSSSFVGFFFVMMGLAFFFDIFLLILFIYLCFKSENNNIYSNIVISNLFILASFLLLFLFLCFFFVY